MRTLIAEAQKTPLWAFACLATFLMPLMLIFARAGAEICCAIIGIAFLTHSARTRNWVWFRTPFARVAFAAWLWLVLVVTPLAFDPLQGLSDALFWFRLPLMVVALRYWVLAGDAVRQRFYQWLLLVLGLTALDSLWQLHTGLSLTGHTIADNGRLTGPFSTPKVGYFLSKLMLLPLAVLLVQCLQQPGWKRGGMAAGFTMLFAATVLLTGERAAFLTIVMALAAGAGLMMLVDKRLRIPTLLAGAAFLIGATLLISTSDRLRERAREATAKFDHFATSDYGVLFNAAIDLGQKHWLHGTGIRGFAALTPVFTLGEAKAAFKGLHPHNAYLEWFAETGLPGVLLYAALVIALFQIAYHQFHHAHGAARLIPIVAIAVLLQHFFPLMPMHSSFKNWSALLVWYSVATMFAALPVGRDKKTA